MIDTQCDQCDCYFTARATAGGKLKCPECGAFVRARRAPGEPATEKAARAFLTGISFAKWAIFFFFLFAVLTTAVGAFVMGY